jgi:hypothetical protein
MLIAVCAELGTVLTYPVGRLMGFTGGEAAAIAMIGGRTGPWSSIRRSLGQDLFVPITIVAYLYLSLTYGGYPFLVRLLIPKKYRGIVIARKSQNARQISPKQKLLFAVVINTVLCLLFPVAAPLFISFFLGIAIRESGSDKYVRLIENVFLYGATFFFGLLLGVLCDARHHFESEEAPAAAARHAGAAALRGRRHSRRLSDVLHPAEELQSGRRHRRRLLRPDDGEDRAKGSRPGQPDELRARLRTRGEHLRRHHDRHPDGIYITLLS